MSEREHDHEALPEGAEAPPPGTAIMAVVRWLLILAMAVAAVAAVGHYRGWFAASAGDGAVYYCPMHPAVQQDHPGECPICSMTLVERTDADAAPPGHAPGTVYACPMHPEVTAMEPGVSCHKCGMKLEPLPPPAGGAAAPTGPSGLMPVELTPDRVQLMGMRTAVVTRERLAAEVRTAGVIAPSESGLAVIQTRFSGWIEELKVEQTGARVSRGQVLATIYSPDLLAAQQELLSALRWAAKPAAGHDTASHGAPGAETLTAGLADDARRRLELLGVSATEIDQIVRTGQPVRALPIRSPVRGHVTAKNAVQGMYVQPGTELFRLADLSKVWALAEVSEYEVDRVRIGQAGRIELSAYPGERFTGVVTFISPSLDPGTRTLRVRLELDNRALRLKPGMSGEVHLELPPAAGPGGDALVVPVEALVDTGDQTYVFVARPGGRFEPRSVKVGGRARGLVQLLEGVAEGEVVVTTANFLLDSESRLQQAWR